MSGLDDVTLQVYMAHEDVIAGFKQWVDSNGWELVLMPRFEEDDDAYVPTHMIVPKNLDQLMRARAEAERAVGIPTPTEGSQHG